MANPSKLYFDSLTNDDNLYWYLTGPGGTEVSSRNFQSSDGYNFGNSDPVLNLIAGNYTLTVWAVGDHTGSYSFRLSDLTTATPLTLGTAASATLNPGNSTSIYQFNANAGDSLYFDVLSGGADYPNT